MNYDPNEEILKQSINTAPPPYQPIYNVQSAQSVAPMILDSSDVTELWEHHLRGEMLVTIQGQRGAVWQRVRKPLVNDEGVADFASICHMYSSKIPRTSDLTTEKINSITERVTHDVILRLTMKWRLYDMRKEDLDMVVNIVRDHIYTSLAGSDHAGMRTALFSTLTEQRIMNAQESINNNRGILDKIGLSGIFHKK